MIDKPSERCPDNGVINLDVGDAQIRCLVNSLISEESEIMNAR